MFRRLSSSFFLSAAAVAAATVTFIGGGIMLGSVTRERILSAEAVMAGEGWARSLGSSLPDLEAVIGGAAPMPETSAFLGKAKKAGNIFRYKLFDKAGRLRFVSDEQKWDGHDTRILAEHNPDAAKTLARGEPFLSAKRGDGVSRPERYASVYLPLRINERTIGTLEVYVDHTAQAGQLSQILVSAAAALTVLTALAFLAPMGAVLWQARRRREMDQRLAHMARHDDLTGMMNRSSITEALDKLLHQGAPIALHFIDLDRFKDVNDTLGHATGDELLKRVTGRLGEVIPADGLIGRLGGDEFAVMQVLIGAMEPQVEAEKLARRIVNILAMPFLLGEHDVQIGGSVGFVTSHDGPKSAAALLKAADIALYAAKRGGRGRAVGYDPSMEGERLERLVMEQRLRAAAAANEFELYYQPLYETDGTTLRGFEALLRLRDNDGNPISPAAFIPLAEEMGLIEKIGAWVLRQACETASLWPDNISVAVNLSPAQFTTGAIVETVRKVLDETGFPPSRLELEVTESLLLHDVETVLNDLLELKALGVSIALDDFGTGYSSLSYLWRFPFDKIKVDGSFMEDIGEVNSKSREVLDTIIALGRVLELKVTAEGVETDDQIVVLRSMNCDLVQGFLFGRPQPVTEVAGTILKALRASKPFVPKVLLDKTG